MCAEPVEATPQALSAAGLDGVVPGSWTLRAGRGCGHCRGTGFKGRRAVAEVLVMNDKLRELVAAQAAISVVKEEARLAGWLPLIDMAVELVASGETTLDEVARVAG
jgi:general secretion pathway protein E